MTFYEAAIRVLESEGRPLHILEITEKSIQQSLLSHIGKTPEQTMLSRLAAMARRTRDRRVIVTAKDTFALVDWAVPEDPEALAQTGLPEENPEEALPPLRPAERHPEPRVDNVRSIGRSERKRRRDEEEERGGRKRRFPPIPEVVFEILSEEDTALTGAELVERARGKELAAEELTAEQLLTALLEDNQRRIDAGRRPQFVFSRDTGRVQLERAGAPSEAPPLELQAAFAEALGIPLEGGRPVLRSLSQAAASPEAQADLALFQTAKAAVKDARRGMARVLRRKLAELDPGTFEKACVKVLHAFNFRELKVAKRSKEGPLLTARKREGSVELRYAIRMLKGNAAIDRKQVQELRRDLGHYSAHVGLLLGAGDVRGDGRSEAQSSGALVMIWGGEALGDKFLEAQVGVNVTTVELFELDDRFFEAARLDAEESARKREERQKQKGERPERGEQPAEAHAEASPAAGSEGGPVEGEAEARPQPARVEAREEALESQTEEGDEEGEDEEGDADLEAASAFVSGQAGEPGAPGAAPGERKRRRRRRRGRGRGPEGAEAGAQPGATPAAGGPEGASAAAGVSGGGEGAASAGGEGAAASAPSGAAEHAVPETHEAPAPERTSVPAEAMGAPNRPLEPSSEASSEPSSGGESGGSGTPDGN